MTGKMLCCKVSPREEKYLMIKFFIAFIFIQTIFALVLCGLSIAHLTTTHLSWFIPIDLITILIAVVILSLIVLILGVASATGNATFAWVWFHLFMIVLLGFEIVVSWFCSDANAIAQQAKLAWETSCDDDREEIQMDLTCCGFSNPNDKPVSPCPQGAYVGCEERLYSVILNIRDIASIALFVDFVFALFIDFAGCAICFHPEVVTLKDQIEEERIIMEDLSEASTQRPSSMRNTDYTASLCLH